MLDANVVNKRLSSFSVPKIMVIQYMKPSYNCSKRSRPEQSYEKPFVNLTIPLTCFKKIQCQYFMTEQVVKVQAFRHLVAKRLLTYY